MAAATQLRPNQNRFSVSGTPTMAINIPTGFQKNLLTNSLTSKLKQRKNNETANFRNGKENLSTIVSAKPPKQARKSSQRASILVSGDVSKSKQERGDSRISASRTGSGVSSVHSEYGAGKSISRRNPRTDSANSDKLPRLSPRHDKDSTGYNRRSSSAGRMAGISSSMSGRFSNSTSFFPTTDSTGIFVEPSGADHTIKVVKRDGVFQPLDKYSSGRVHNHRDSGIRTKKVVCDYDLLTLPYGDAAAYSDGTTTNQTLPVSRGRSDISKKSMRVSWHENADPRFDGNLMESYNYNPDTNFTPVNTFSTVNNTNNNSNNNPKDTMAFRKPIHSSGKSSVRSIGLNWTVPTIASDNNVEEPRPQATSNPTPTTTTPSKPMWSWLLAPESRSSTIPRKTNSGKSPNQSIRSSPSSKKKENLNSDKRHSLNAIPRSSSMLDVSGNQHRRDVHPVATAMDREGTSVSKTKWQVPTSTPSSEFLKQVKDIQSFYKIIPAKRSPRSGPHSQPSGLYHSSRSYGVKMEDKETESDEEDNEDDDDSTYDVDEYNAVMMNAMRYDDEVMTTGTTRKGYSNSSPNKSVSDQC